jgi:DNA mismatch repair protein MutS2
LGAAVEAGARAERRLSELARPAHPATELAVGDRVLVADLGVSGTVTSIDGDTVEVQGPSARLRLNRARLVRDARVDATPPAAPPVETRPVARAIGPEVDVRGQRADAACAAVREYVDAAAMAGLETVRIVHGRGTGALRAAVRDELDRHPLVARAQIAGPDEGGDGATIATLR